MSSGSETPSNRWTSRITRSRGHSVSPVAARRAPPTACKSAVNPRRARSPTAHAMVAHMLESPQEGDEVLFLVRRQPRAQDQVEELHRVVEGQQTPVVQVGRRVFD